MEPISLAKDALRVATSQALATAARLDDAVRTRTEAALTRADLPRRADVRRLSARVAALQREVDTLRALSPSDVSR